MRFGNPAESVIARLTPGNCPEWLAVPFLLIWNSKCPGIYSSLCLTVRGSRDFPDGKIYKLCNYCESLKDEVQRLEPDVILQDKWEDSILCGGPAVLIPPEHGFSYVKVKSYDDIRREFRQISGV